MGSVGQIDVVLYQNSRQEAVKDSLLLKICKTHDFPYIKMSLKLPKISLKILKLEGLVELEVVGI